MAGRSNDFTRFLPVQEHLRPAYLLPIRRSSANIGSEYAIAGLERLFYFHYTRFSAFVKGHFP